MFRLAIKRFGIPVFAFATVIAYSLAVAPAYAQSPAPSQSPAPWDETAIENHSSGTAGDPNCEVTRIQSPVVGGGLVWHPLIECPADGDSE